MIRAVLDTNVLASGFIGETKLDSTPGELLRRWRARQFILIVSDQILAELARTFATPWFTTRLSAQQITDALAALRRGAMIQPITIRVSGIATHPEDDGIIATAVSARAPYLVTGDTLLRERHAYRGTIFLSPRQFLDVLENEQ